MTFCQRVEKAICCWRKKSLQVKPKKGTQEEEDEEKAAQLDIEDDEYLEIIRMRDLKLQQRDSLNFFEFRHWLRSGLRAIIEL
jgi:hypothetical protein